MSRRLLTLLAGLVVLARIGYGIHAWLYSLRHVTTDGAYVDSTIAPLSAKVGGHVVRLYVDDNQSVKTGNVLLRIDPRDYEAKRDQARAAVAVAAASFQSARSDAELTRETTRAQADEARAAMSAEVTGARSSSTQALREKDRMQRLVQAGYVSQRDFDVADAAAATSAAALDATQRRLTVAEREIQQAEAELAGRVLAVAQARQR